MQRVKLIESIANDMRKEDAGSGFEGNELDRQYFAALERGDEETAKRMVRAAAAEKMAGTKVVAEDGLPVVVWHATGWNPYSEPVGRAVFTKEKIGSAHDKGWFGSGFYFGRTEGGVRRYLPHDERGAVTGGRAFPFFLDIKNPRFKPEGGYDSDTPIENDGIIIGGDRYYEKPYWDPINWGEFVAFSPNQIKSANLVTRDGEGDVIPLSQRFDMSNPDIRY